MRAPKIDIPFTMHTVNDFTGDIDAARNCFLHFLAKVRRETRDVIIERQGDTYGPYDTNEEG